MYTVEFCHDMTTIVTMDERDEFNDVELTLTDSGAAFLTQYDDELGSSEMLMLSEQQLLDLLASMNSTEGLFRAKLRGRQ